MNARNVVSFMVIVWAVSCAEVSGAAPATEKSVTLLGMLTEWQYPDSTFNGATMSDGGAAGAVSVKCKAVLRHV